MHIKPYVYELTIFASDYDLFKNPNAGLGGRIVARSLQNAMVTLEAQNNKADQTWGKLENCYCYVLRKSWLTQLMILLLPKYHCEDKSKHGWVKKKKGQWYFV